jgi:hypothetical protein
MRLAAAAIILVLMAAPARAGETACWFENGAVVIPAAFGDIAGDFILDASAPASQLHVTTAQTFGVEAPTVRATLRLAGERRVKFDMQVADLGARTRPFVTGIAGVIGADALMPFVIEIATSPCRVRLSRRARPEAESIRLPLRVVGGTLAVKAAISDGVTARQGWFAVDTGADTTLVADARLSRSPAEGTDPPVRLRALSIGGLLFEQIPAGLMADPPTGVSGVIGEAIWSRFRLRLDPRRGWVTLRPAADSEPVAENHRQAQLRFQSRQSRKSATPGGQDADHRDRDDGGQGHERAKAPSGE